MSGFVHGNQHVTGLNRPNARKKSDSWADGLLPLLCPAPHAFPDHGELLGSHSRQACSGRWETRSAPLPAWFPAGGRGPRSQGAPSRSEPDSPCRSWWSASLSHALSSVTQCKTGFTKAVCGIVFLEAWIKNKKKGSNPSEWAVLPSCYFRKLSSKSQCCPRAPPRQVNLCF